MDIIRILPSVEEPTENLAYFIEVPAGGRVTINGHTYVNDIQPDGGDVLPFFVGPLTRYTVIELLSQAVFFFRTRGDLDYTNTKTIASGAKARPNAEELGRRDTNGDVAADAVEVIWTPISDTPDEDPPSESKSPAKGSGQSSDDITSEEFGEGEKHTAAREYSDD